MSSTLDRRLSALDQSHFTFGNAQEDSFPFRDWLLGHFVPEADGLRHSSDIEIKWGVHTKGTADRVWSVNRTATTISILVAGADEISLPHQTFTLARPGGYLIWGPGMPHRWKAIEDCTVIAVRWPSTPGDQFEASDDLVEQIRALHCSD